MEVPYKNKHAYESVLAALGKFADSNVISMDLKRVENDDSQKQIQIALTTFVPASERTKVRDSVADYLENLIDKGDAEVGHEVRLGTKTNANKEQLDLVMRYGDTTKLTKPQVIRVLVLSLIHI